MAAVCATSCFDARRGRGSSDRKMPPWKIGLDDCEWGGGVEADDMPWPATRRCDGGCMERAPRWEVPTRILARFCWSIRLDSARSKHYTESAKVLDVSPSTPPPYGNSPPPYWDAVADAPPDYTTTDDLAEAYTDGRPASLPYRDSRRREQKVGSLLEDPMSPRAVDLGDTSGFVTHGGAKKKKQAAKQANQAKWANSDDEGGGKEGGEANENAGGAGGSNNGDGGAGGDDGDDWWDTGKKKKGKKGKGGVDEDEKKKREEEEERKRKEEEEKAKQEEEDIGNGNNPLSWADSVGDANANPDDEWGGFTTTAKKGKKGKKGKAADSVPGPPPPPPAPPAPAGSTDPPSIGTFDDINLDDGVPKLDLDFGASTTKETGSSFGFGGWGNSWNTGSKWDFSSADAGTTAPVNNAKESKGDLADNNPWSFGKKKDKKSTFSSGFDFGDLGSVGETQEEQPKSNGVGKEEEEDFGGFTSIGKKDKKKGKKAVPEALPEEEPAAVVVPEAETANGDSWGGWGTASSKKDKKKGKKGVIEEVPGEEPAVVVVPEPETAADDSWGGWGSKKDKKKGKKGEQEPLPPPPPPAPPEPVAAVEEEWGTFGTKNKKKGKKGAVEQVSKVEEPVIAVLPEPDAEADEYPEYENEGASAAVPDTWGSFSTKKDKKKGKKGATEEITRVEDPVAVVAPEVINEPTTTAADDTWGSFTTKKDKKKGKKGVVEEISKVEEPIVTVPDPETAAPATDDLWSSFGSKKDKKKGKKGAVEEISQVEHPPIVAFPDPAPTFMSDEWGTFGAKKDKKKGKNGAFEEPIQAEDPGIMEVPEQESTVNIGWGGWGGPNKNDKKSKKKGITEVVDVPITVNEPAPAVEEVSTVADDDWMNWGTGKKKDKKGKKGAVADTKADETLPPPPPPPPVVPSALEDSKTEDWGSFGTSKQNKDKKGKKGKVSEPAPTVPVPEPLVAVVDEPDVAGVEDSWGTWGLSSKDKKKKEKEKAKRLGQDISIEVVEDPTTMSGAFPDAIVDLDAPAETDTWGIWGTGSKKDKKKAGKRDHVLEAPPPAPTPPAQGLTPEPASPPFPALDDSEEGEWAAFAPVKTKGKKDVKKDPLPRTTSISKGAKIEDTKSDKKGAKEPVDDYFDDLDGGDEDKSAVEVKKESPKEETPAKAVRGFWGSFGSTATSKPKTAKDKAKEKEEEKSKVQAEEEIKNDPILEIVDRTDKKGSKNKKDNKLRKVESKGSVKSGKVDDPKGDDIDALIDLMDGDAELNEDDLAELADSLDKKDDKKADAWSFWGSSKKPTGKKADEPKKEIGKQASTNQKAALGKLPNEPETPMADQPLPPPPPPSTATAMNKSISAKSKVAGKLSVSEKIKALEKEKEKKTEPILPPPPPEPEPPPKADTAPKKANSLAKAKPVTATKGAAASKKKDLSPDPAKDKASAESVPGSFPSEGADDDIIDVIDLGPIDKKVTKKAKKGAEKANMDPMVVDVPALPSPPTPPAPPTPPPEPTAAKPVKKERARVVRGEGASSWGFWGAAPKKEVKKEKAVKDDVDGVSPPAPVKAKASPPAMVRSKSTKTAKNTEKSSSKSSGSDKVTKPEAKPSKSRGMSFSQLLMGGPSPARTKSIRRSSNAVPKNGSRRQSVDVGTVGLMSPPPDDQPEVSAKAAKLMGMGSAKMDRRPSSKGKQKAPGVVPDPYAIDDDDDLIMVNGDDDALVDDVPIQAPSSKKVRPETRAKKLVGPAPSDGPNPPPLAPTTVLPERPGRTRHYSEPVKANGKSKPKQFGGATAATDDIVMVEAGPSNDGPEVTTGSDDLAFVLPPRKPAPLKRSMSSAKKPEKLMGLFGSFRKSRRASETFERPKSKAVYGDDDTKRLRREDRKVRRSGKDENDAEIFNADVLPGGGATTEPEEQGARKDDRRSPKVSRDSPTKRTREAEARAAEERRARRREAEKAEEEVRRAKAREAREKRVREEEEDEARRREEKKMRRAAREDRYAGKNSPDGENGIKNGEHRRRHRDKGFSSGAPSPMVDERSPRPRKTDRRRSHTDKPVPRYGADEEADRRVRREARRAREGLNRRKSAPPVEDYFDPRNGTRGIRPNEVMPDVPVYSAPAPLPTHADPYLNGANDPTSSWVNSQIIEPPAPPPVEPTVIEPPPTGSGRKHDELDDSKDVRREARRAHRHSKYTSVTPDGGDDRRRRRDSRRTERDGIRSSEGSEGDRYTRRKSDYAGYENGGPVRTFDGRLAGAGAGKRGSWFKKIANL